MGWNATWKGSEMLVNEARKYVEAAFEKLTPAKAQEMAKSIVQGAGKEQVEKLAHDLMEWSTKSRTQLSEFIDHQVKEQLKRNSAKATELVQREVQRQLKALGVATKDDLDALKRRVRELERGGAPKSSTVRKRVAKKATAKKPVAKRPGTPSTS